eukprot:10611573-Ditylum_brightwellii.AAC.1
MATESLLLMLLLGATAAVVRLMPCYMSHILIGHSFENAQTYVPDAEETPVLEFVYSALKVHVSEPVDMVDSSVELGDMYEGD